MGGFLRERCRAKALGVKLRILLVSSVFRPAVFGSGEEDGMRE
jgi:hypothetical protein